MTEFEILRLSGVQTILKQTGFYGNFIYLFFENFDQKNWPRDNDG